MMRTRWLALAALWLLGCGIYGPPERTARPAAPPSAPAEQCPEPEDAE